MKEASRVEALLQEMGYTYSQLEVLQPIPISTQKFILKLSGYTIRELLNDIYHLVGLYLLNPPENTVLISLTNDKIYVLDLDTKEFQVYLNFIIPLRITSKRVVYDGIRVPVSRFYLAFSCKKYLIPLPSREEIENIGKAVSNIIHKDSTIQWIVINPQSQDMLHIVLANIYNLLTKLDKLKRLITC